ncbi:Transcription factor b [Sesamum alatum]|uniref:Transcription factor b n=1 Tax=Sesamum alatum TaxID=300844 RepID=A0AAE1YGC5_9LAMI|nr:Transcription factor b [Sesamum alatum]
MAQSNLKQQMNQTLNVGGPHSRSFSQPMFFANNCLPPLSPFPPSESSLASSNSNLKDASMEDVDVSSRGPSVAPPFARECLFRGSENLPPRRGHRRSNSDVPLGFSAMIQSSPQLVPISSQGNLGGMVNVRETSGNEKPVGLSRREMDTVSYGKGSVEGIGDIKSEGEVVDDLFNSLMNLDQVDALRSSGMQDKEKDSTVCSNIESESVSRNGTTSREGVKRSAAGEITPPPRHYRSLSMDSAMEKICLGDQSTNLQTSLCNRVDQLSPSNSISENSGKFNLDFGHGEFNDIELKKIMADERLAEIAMSDPKRAKRILANRQSAARSKERKLRYISELEHKVQTLQTEATTLSAQVTILEKEYAELTSQNNELKFRVQAMEQQAQLRDALHEALTAEVQRLKLANMELREERRTSNEMAQQVTMKHHGFSMQHQQPNQMQRLSAPTSTTSTTASTAPASA